MNKRFSQMIATALTLFGEVDNAPMPRRQKAKNLRTPEQQQRTIEAAQEKRERRAARRRKHARKHCPEEE